ASATSACSASSSACSTDTSRATSTVPGSTTCPASSAMLATLPADSLRSVIERSATTVPTDVVVRWKSRASALAAVIASVGSGRWRAASSSAARASCFQAARPPAATTSAPTRTIEAIGRDRAISAPLPQQRVEDEGQEVLDRPEAAVDLHPDRRALPEHDEHVGQPLRVVAAAQLARVLRLADDLREQLGPARVGGLDRRVHRLAELAGLEGQLGDQALARGAVDLAVLAALLEDAAQAGQGRALAVAEHGPELLDEFGARALDERHAEVLLAAEVVVEGPLRDAGPLEDLGQAAAVEALLGDGLRADLEDPVAGRDVTGLRAHGA